MTQRTLEGVIARYYAHREGGDCDHAVEFARHVAGDLSESQEISLRSHVDTCPQCQATQASLEALPDAESFTPAVVKWDEAQIEQCVAHYMALPDRDRCARGVELARYAAGDLVQEEQSAFRSHLEICLDCRRDLEQFHAVAGAWASAAPATPPRRRRWLRSFGPPAIAALAASVAVFIAVDRSHEPPRLPDSRPGLQVKGAHWRVEARIVHDGQIIKVQPGMTLPDQTLLGLYYAADDPGHLMVIGARSSGQISVIHPADGETSQAMEPAYKPSPLPKGLKLRAGEACVWIVAVFSPNPLSVGTVVNAVSAWAPPRDDCQRPPLTLPGAEVKVLSLKQ